MVTEPKTTISISREITRRLGISKYKHKFDTYEELIELFLKRDEERLLNMDKRNQAKVDVNPSSENHDIA